MDRRGEIAQQVSLIMPQIARTIVVRIEETFDLTPAQIFLLLGFEDQDGMRISDLSRMMQVTAPTMTGIVSRLESGGYVYREHDTQDRRVVRVYLTSEGKKIIKHIRSIAEDRWGAILEKLPLLDCESFVDILKKVLKNL